ncbi:phage holin family protein [Kribbella sp. NPDC023855]|uniref:phage holin family protein n=1 Tax=Kribbella sp. NPDC023855 TaxID=3154698 RepID=UPI0033D80517
MSFEGSTSATAGTQRVSVDESVGELVSQLTTDLGDLTRQELALAKAELQAEAKKAGKGAGMLGGAALAGWMVALFLSLTIMWALGEAMDLVWAALIVTVLWAIAAAVLATRGRKELREVSPKPDQTVESLKEDAKWLKTRKS